MDWTAEQRQRYQRHFSLPGFGEPKQAVLAQSCVLLVGAGGLACPAIQYLAAAGVGRLIIVDDDRVEPSNLQRQVLYGEGDVGAYKAEVAAAQVKRINPLVAVEARVARLTFENARDWVAQVDVVLDGSDNLPTRYLINDACLLEGTPWVYGAIFAFSAQVSVFNYEEGPTYRCLFPQTPDAADAPSCAEVGVLGVLPGMVGCVQAVEAIKVLTGLGEPLSGVLWSMDTLTMQSQRFQFGVNEAMRALTEIVPVVDSCGGLVAEGEVTVAQLRALRDGQEPFHLLDVRELWEREVAMIEGDVHWPLADLLAGERQPEGLSMETPLVVYCQAGARSARAVEVLRERYPLAKVSSLAGGVEAFLTRVMH